LLSGESWEGPSRAVSFMRFTSIIRYQVVIVVPHCSSSVANLAGNIDIELAILVDHKGSSNDPDLHIHLT
jgi:hypothetical protein